MDIEVPSSSPCNVDACIMTLMSMNMVPILPKSNRYGLKKKKKKRYGYCYVPTDLA